MRNSFSACVVGRSFKHAADWKIKRIGTTCSKNKEEHSWCWGIFMQNTSAVDQPVACKLQPNIKGTI